MYEFSGAIAAWQAQWGFAYNTPMIITNFVYTTFFLTTFLGVATGVYAARQFKKVEDLLPADEAFEAAVAERNAEREAKRAAKSK